ncbi:hypothetical protein LTR60_002806, partial [Cryomyces antarcticus]
MRAIETSKTRKGNPNLTTAIVAGAEKGEARLDDLDVRTESPSLIFAGSGTTANTLTFLSWAVLQRPGLLSDLEEEVSALREGFSDTDLEALPLLNAVLQETLRLYCAVPGTRPRVVPPAGTTIGGHFIPQGLT